MERKHCYDALNLLTLAPLINSNIEWERNKMCVEKLSPVVQMVLKILTKKLEKGVFFYEESTAVCGNTYL